MCVFDVVVVMMSVCVDCDCDMYVLLTMLTMLWPCLMDVMMIMFVVMHDLMYVDVVVSVCA